MCRQYCVFRAFFAHLLKCSHAAFIACSPSLDSFADPHFFLDELLVKIGLFFGFCVEEFLLACKVGFVVTIECCESAAVEV